MSAFTAGIVLLFNIWGGQRSGLSIDPNKEMGDVHKCMKMLHNMETRYGCPRFDCFGSDLETDKVAYRWTAMVSSTWTSELKRYRRILGISCTSWPRWVTYPCPRQVLDRTTSEIEIPIVLLPRRRALQRPVYLWPIRPCQEQSLGRAEWFRGRRWG